MSMVSLLTVITRWKCFKRGLRELSPEPWTLSNTAVALMNFQYRSYHPLALRMIASHSGITCLDHSDNLSIR